MTKQLESFVKLKGNTMDDDVMDNLIRLGKEVERSRIITLILMNRRKPGFTFDDLIDLLKEDEK